MAPPLGLWPRWRSAQNLPPLTRASHLALASYMLSGRGRRNHAYDRKILIPTETGNHAVKDGSLRKILEAKRAS
jgi:hypothetical protein